MKNSVCHPSSPQYFTGVPTEVDVNRDYAWNSLKSLIKNQYQSKISIIAWIHVGGNQVSSVDLHTQKTWSNDFPDILGLSLEVNEDRVMPEKFDFYALTRQGNQKLMQCKQTKDQIHVQCQKKSFYKSFLDYVKFTDGPLEIIYDIFEIVLDDPMEVQSDTSQIDDDPMEEDVDDFWKFCTGCKKPFYDPGTFSRHVSHSKKCKSSYGEKYTDWYKKRSKDSNRKRQQKWTQNENNKESKRKYMRKYDKEHQDEIKDYKQRYYKENQDQKKEYQKNQNN